MSVPTVSVVIPTYNRAYCIKDAIDSVLAQSFQDYELIIVDDGSTDNTPEVVRACGGNIKLIRQSNGGVAAARNAGVKAAQGEWIAFLDSDDTWEKDKLKVQVEDLRSNPGAVAHMVDAIITGFQPKPVSLFEVRRKREEFERQTLRGRPLCDVLETQFFTSCWMMRREAVEKAGYFDNSLKIFEDIDLLTRVALEGPFVVKCYRGTNMRRISGGVSALSKQYQEVRLQSLLNLIHTYSRLKQDPRLSIIELRRVQRFLGGVRCEVARVHKREQQWRAFISALFSSIEDEPGLRSMARALLTAAGLDRHAAQLLFRGRNPEHFRRSEMDHSSGNT